MQQYFWELPEQLFALLSREGESSVDNLIDMDKINESLYQISMKCLGWSKIVASFLYIILFIYTFKSSNPCSNKELVVTLDVLLMSAVSITVFYGAALLSGAQMRKVMLIHYAMLLCEALVFLDLLIGVLGICVYSAGASETENIILIIVYVFLLVQIFWAQFFDFRQILTYAKLLKMDPIVIESRNVDKATSRQRQYT